MPNCTIKHVNVKKHINGGLMPLSVSSISYHYIIVLLHRTHVESSDVHVVSLPPSIVGRLRGTLSVRNASFLILFSCVHNSLSMFST